MSVIKHLFKAVAVITVFTIATRVMGFLFRIYLANKIGSEALGVYQIGFSLFIVLATVVGSGLPLSISKLTAKYQEKKDTKSEHNAVSAAMIIGLAVSILITFAVFTFKNPISSLLASQYSINILLMLVPAIIATAIFSSFRGSLWGHKRHFAVSFTEFVEQIVRTILAVVFLEFGIFNLTGAMSASLALTIGCFFSALMAGWYYFKNGGKLVRPKRKYYSTVLKSAGPITGVRVASSLIQPLIAVLIPLRLVAVGYTTSQALSLLGVAVGMSFPLLFLPITVVGALSTALIPELSALMENKKEKEFARQVNASLIFSLFVACLVVPVYIGLGREIGEFLFNNMNSGAYLQSAAWIMVPISLASITASILNTLNLEIKSFRHYIIGSIVLVLSIWFLPRYIGIESLIVGMGLCMSIVTALNYRMIKSKITVNRSLFKEILKMALFIIPATLVCRFTIGTFSYLFPAFIAIALSATLSVIMFVLLCLVFDVINFDLWFLNLKNLKLLNKNKKTKTQLA